MEMYGDSSSMIGFAQKNIAFSNNELSSLVYNQSNHRVQQSFINLNTGETSYREIIEERGQDHILGSLPTFKKDGSIYSIYQTKTKLKFTNGEQVDSYDIDRVSFVSGQIFNQIFLPLNLERPTVYIDATQINSSHVFALSINDSDRWSSKIKNSFSLNEKCLALNPGKMNGQSSFLFLCQKEESFVIKSIPLLIK